MDAIQLFAKNFVGITYEDLPQDVVEVTKKEVLNFLGVALEKVLKKAGIRTQNSSDDHTIFASLPRKPSSKCGDSGCLLQFCRIASWEQLTREPKT